MLEVVSISNYAGFQGRILAGAELTASYGTEASSYDTIGLLQGSIKVDETNNLVEVGGTGHRNAQAILAAKYDVTGSFDYQVQGNGFPVFSLGMYDATSPVADTPVLGVYKHYMKSNDTTRFPSFSLHLGIDDGSSDKEKIVLGTKVTSQSFRGDLETPISSTVNWQGKTVDISGSTALSVTEIATDPWMMHSVGTVMDTGTDAMKAKVTGFDWTITDTLKPIYAADDRLKKDILCTKQSLAGNLTLNFEDYTEYEKFLSSGASPTAPIGTGNVAEFDTTLTFANQASGSETTAYRGTTFELQKCKFNTHSDDIPKEGELTETFGFICETAEIYYYDVTSADTYAFS